jgi:hypothetical protein
MCLLRLPVHILQYKTWWVTQTDMHILQYKTWWSHRQTCTYYSTKRGGSHRQTCTYYSTKRDGHTDRHAHTGTHTYTTHRHTYRQRERQKCYYLSHHPTFSRICRSDIQASWRGVIEQRTGIFKSIHMCCLREEWYQPRAPGTHLSAWKPAQTQHSSTVPLTWENVIVWAVKVIALTYFTLEKKMF